MASIGAALGGLASGRGGLFLVVGPAGIGKTRLADEASREARAAGIGVHWGRAWEGGGAPPFWPWIEILRSILAALSPAERAACYAPFASDLSHLVGIANLDEPASAPALESEQTRFRLFDSVSSFFQRAAACTPQLLVLDDLHDADASSVNLLRFVARALPGIPAMILATYRDGEARTSSTASVFAALAREGRSLLLPPLTPDDVRALVAVSGRPTAKGFADAVHRMSAGIPYFVDSILRHALAERGGRSAGALEASSLKIPAEATAAALYDLEALGGDTLNLLGAAAVIGAEFSVASLAALTGIAVAEIDSRLDRAAEVGAVEQRDAPARAWHFRHSIVREALYQRLSAADRGRLHESLARHLAGNPVVDDHGAEVVATHYLLAGTTREPTAALHWAMRAGEQAERVYAYEQGVTWFARALSAAERLADSEATKRSLEAMARALSCSGEADAARDAYRRLWEMARRDDDPLLLGRAALGLAHHTLLPVAMELPIARPPAADCLHDALAVVTDEAGGLRAMLRARLALELCEQEGATARTEGMSAAAVAEAEECGDARALAYCLALRHTVMWGRAAPGERLALIERIRHLARVIGDVDLSARTTPLRVSCLLELGEIAAVEREVRDWEERSGRQRHPFDSWYIPLFRACLALLRGSYPDATELAHRAMRDGFRLVGLDAVYADAVQQLFVSRDVGNLRARKALLRELVAATPESTALRIDLALIYAEGGKLAAARELFEPLAASEFKSIRRNALWLGHLCLLGDVAVALGDRARGEILFDRLRLHANDYATAGAVFLGSVSHYLARLALCLGRLAEAEGYARDACECHERLHARPWLVRSTLVCASIAEARRDTPAATRLRGSAEELAARIGMALPPRLGPHDLDVSNDTAHMRDLPRAIEAAAFVSAGESWRAEFGGKGIVVPALKGCDHIAYLLRRPGIDVTALDLLSPEAEIDPDGMLTTMGDAQLEGEGLRRGGLGHAGERLDRAARRAYQSRIAELRENLHEAERNRDLGRAERTRHELDFLSRELVAAIGLDGRDRVAAAAVERARLTVTKRIRAALRRIEAHHPGLARFLRDSIHTGALCRYSPPPDRVVQWRFD